MSTEIKDVYCECGNLLLSLYAVEGDKCLYCMDKPKATKPLKSQRRDNTRNQWHTGFWK